MEAGLSPPFIPVCFLLEDTPALEAGVTEAKVRSMQTQLPYKDPLGQGTFFLPVAGSLENLP